MNKNTVFCIVVDDEPLAQKVVENYINRIKELKLVATCESVEDAYKVIASKEVDVVFLDIDLKGRSGVELIEKMKLSPARRYYVIVTSATSPERLKTADVFDNRVMFVDHLTKPFSFDRFVQAVDKITF